MGVSDSSTGSQVELSVAQRLDQVSKKVRSNWFPPNPKLLNRIHLGLQSGAYDLDIEFLISEIKSDFALFTYCLKEIARMRDEKELSVPPKANPIAMMRIAGFEVLKTILSVKQEEISQHDGKNIGDLQAMRLQESMVSASTAEVLSDRHNIDPNVGFSTGLLRQLGLTLIAWNYPKLYQETLRDLSPDSTIDDDLTRKLGLSPKLLGIHISRQWGLAIEYRAAMSGAKDELDAAREAGEERQPEEEERIVQVAERLEKICEIGEALARANNPEQYPSAVADWEVARVGIEESLGHAGMKIIQQRVKENCENYATLVPEVFKKEQIVAPEIHIHEYREGNLFKKNEYLRHCSPKIQELFARLHKRFDPDRVHKDNLRILAQEIIPRMGFTRGCIYLLDPATLNLVPRLKIGDAELQSYKVVPYNDEAQRALNPILEAYGSNSPIMRNPAASGGTGPTFIASVVGRNHRAGVMYLEVSPGLLKNAGQVPLLLFKAASQALNDCLNLR